MRSMCVERTKDMVWYPPPTLTARQEHILHQTHHNHTTPPESETAPPPKQDSNTTSDSTKPHISQLPTPNLPHTTTNVPKVNLHLQNSLSPRPSHFTLLPAHSSDYVPFFQFQRNTPTPSSASTSTHSKRTKQHISKKNELALHQFVLL